MNELQIFQNEEFGKVRAILIDNEPWLIGKDVAVALGYKDTKSALQDHVEDEDKKIIQKRQIATLEIPNRGMTFINESGFYSLVLSSKLPNARKFKHWVTSEVLPTIRKTGGYQNNVVYELDTRQISFIVAEVVKEIIPVITKSVLKIEDKQCKKRKRRTHNRFGSFPAEIRLAAEKMWFESNATYKEIAEFCCKNGCNISKSSVGRYFTKQE